MAGIWYRLNVRAWLIFGMSLAAFDCRTNRQGAIFYDWPLHIATDIAYQSLATELGEDSLLYIDQASTYGWLCDPSTDACGPYVPGTSTVGWYDEGHLSTAGSLYLAPFVNCYLEGRGLLA